MTDAAFWDRLAPRYFCRPIANPVDYEATLNRVREYLRPQDRLLELGCGTGGTAIRLAPSVAQITSTDYSAGMIAMAQGRLDGDAPRNVAFIQAPATGPVPGAPFDVVCAFNLLHLLPDLPSACAAIRGMIRPGGLFLSKSPCIADAGVAVRMVLPVLRLVRYVPRVNVFDAAALEAAIRGAGFEILDVEDIGGSRFVAARRR